jgi:hypothetical protein
MKIYTRCVYGWQPDGSLKLEESESFDYEGPVALCKDSPAPPATPDYVGAAQAQGVANKEAGLASATMGNPNISSPYGTQTVTYNQNGPENNWTPNITQTLSPASQQILDAQNATKLGLAGLGQQGLGTAQRVMGTPFNYGGPNIQTSIQNAGTRQNPIGNSLNSVFSGGGTPLQGVSSSDFNSIMESLQNGGNGGANVQKLQTALQGMQNAPIDAPNLFGFGQAGANVNAGQGMATTPDLFGMGTAYGSVPRTSVQSSLGDYGRPVTGLGDYGQAATSLGNYGQAASNLDLSNVAKMPVNAGQTAYDAMMSRLNPELDQQRNAAETQLRNQGLVAGGEAYSNSRRLLDQSQNDARMQAAAQAIGIDLSANQQGFNQAQAQGQFANNAQAQNYGQALGAGQFANQGVAQNYNQALGAGQFANQGQAQAYNQALGAGQFGNQAAGQQFGQNLQEGQFWNQALAQNQQAALAQQAAQNAAQQQQFGQQFGVQGLQNQAIGQNQGAALTQQQAQNAAQLQAFNQALQGGQFGNTAQQQAYGQAYQNYNIPLNQISALMSGSQINNPQFQQYQGSNVAPAPIGAATGQQAQYNQGLYGLQVGQQNANTSAAASTALAAAMYFSDRRLKSNIERIGTHPLGIGIYEYDIFGSRDTGVMADEVLTVKPEAVLTHPSGFLMVDYGRL